MLTDLGVERYCNDNFCNETLPIRQFVTLQRPQYTGIYTTCLRYISQCRALPIFHIAGPCATIDTRCDTSMTIVLYSSVFNTMWVQFVDDAILGRLGAALGNGIPHSYFRRGIAITPP
eukprot:4744291-Pyramimonas_sp.AAC.1